MMGANGTQILSAREWWTEAEGDLGLLPHQVPPEGYGRTACFSGWW